MKNLIKKWREKAVLEKSKAKECFDEGCEIWSEGHSSAHMIYNHCADELERHLSHKSTQADLCTCKPERACWFRCTDCGKDIY